MSATHSRFTVAVLVVVVALAGCGAPVAESNATGETGANITVTNGSLAVDADSVFTRVQQLRGTGVEAPEQIRAYNTIEGFRNQSGSLGGSRAQTFSRLAGMTTGDVNVSDSVTAQKNGYVTGLGSIVLYLGENATLADEQLLVSHELTHYVQVRNGRQQQVLNQTGGAVPTSDTQYVLRALLEGDAVVTANAYLEQYSESERLNSPMYYEVQESLPDGHVARYANSQYVHGFEYVEAQTDSPADVADVYDAPPLTSEQLLHNLSAKTEPPTPLSVSIETNSEWVTSGDDRMGEAFVRYALESQVGPDRAARAAAGWGNDTVRFLRPADGDGETAYAWTLRWDDAANQTEFTAAFRESLSARGTETDGTWRLTEESVSATVSTPTDRTTVVLFGPESLVDRMTASGNEGSVRIALETVEITAG